MRDFYETIVDTEVPVSSPRVAEMAKVFENTQAYVNIALINELADICHELGIDVYEMIDAAMTKGHSMARWTPGRAWEATAFPSTRSTWLGRPAHDLGRPFRFAELAHESTMARPQVVVDRITACSTARSSPSTGLRSWCSGWPTSPASATCGRVPALHRQPPAGQPGARVTVCDPHVRTGR